MRFWSGFIFFHRGERKQLKLAFGKVDLLEKRQILIGSKEKLKIQVSGRESQGPRGPCSRIQVFLASVNEAPTLPSSLVAFR